jgi:two-component system LytT family response regulator
MTTGLRVLIVDDEPLARQRLRHLLAEIPGTEVVGECGDGTDAARAIGELAPDVVLLDVQMREMDGFALVDAIGADRMPPVVFVTAHDQFALRAFDVSAATICSNPFRRRSSRVRCNAPPSVAAQRIRRCTATFERCSTQ